MMSQSPSSFEGLDFTSLLQKAGVQNKNNSESSEAGKGKQADRVARVRAIQIPTGRDMGDVLKALLGDLNAVLQMPLFVADDDGLLLAGSGDLPTIAASLAADAIRSLKKQASYTAGNIDAFLVKASPKDYLVFGRQHEERTFIVGALVTDEVHLEALRVAADLIWETLFTRIQHA